MTFLFECFSPDDYVYVNADDLSSAIDIYKSHYASEYSGLLHVYVRIV